MPFLPPHVCCAVARVAPNGPADKSGLRLGDRLWNVADHYVRAWSAVDVRGALEACPSTVQLRVEPTLRKLQLLHARQGYGFTLGQPQVSKCKHAMQCIHCFQS